MKMNELELEDREDCAPLTTATRSPSHSSQTYALGLYNKFCRDKAINNIEVRSTRVVSFRKD